MTRCLVCESPTDSFMDFGRMPISNRFLSADEFDDEFFYDLSVAFCPNCYMVQLGERVPPEMMFNEDYAYFSSISTVMAEHFEALADEIAGIVTERPSPLVVELGCNDGIMLQHIARREIRHVGIEPSANVAVIAKEKGITVFEKFFGVDSAREIESSFGQADVICGANVMCHIEDINSVMSGVAMLLRDDGVLIFEDPYLLDIIRQTSFDQIYDEHVFYFSALSVSELARRHGMQLVDVQAQAVHGGSMRYYIRQGTDNDVSSRLGESMVAERACGLHRSGDYSRFRDDVDRVSADLRRALEEICARGETVVGYGATSKSTTLQNYAGIGPDLITYISDTTPTKIGRFTPGTHIPIRSHARFRADSPPYTLLLAWNHRREILEKEEEYRQQGGKFITFFPELKIE
mgnify:CR=1 FL=1